MTRPTSDRWIAPIGALLLLAGVGAVVAGLLADPASISSLLFGRRLRLDPSQTAQIAFVKDQIWITGAASAVAGLLLLLFGRRVAALLRLGAASTPPAGRAYRHLFLVSALALFFEVVFVRWISTEVRIFAFFKNIPLIAAYLGFGIGCLKGESRSRLEVLFVPALAAFLLFVGLGSDTYLRVVSFAGATVGSGELLLWGHTFVKGWIPLAAAVFYGGLALLFALQVLLFVPLGQMVGQGFTGLPRIPAYSVNIAGSLVGIGAYTALSQLRIGPQVWFLLGCVPFLWLVRDRKRELAVSAALLAAALAMQGRTMLPRTWSAYNRISVNDSYLWKCPDGVGKTFPETEADLVDAGRTGEWVHVGKRLDVGDLFYMDINDMSEGFLARSPQLYGDLRLYSYNLPYTILKPRSVCVVGSGGGNDVAAALRAGVAEVVAVEIDAAIADEGAARHPEQPYGDPRVTLVTDDARHFFNTTDRKFDLVVFGLLDSHSLFSTFSSVRLDNYVYTREAFERTRAILAPDGSVACCFAVRQPWIQERFAAMFEQVFERPTLVTHMGRGVTFLTGLRDDYEELARAAGVTSMPRDPALVGVPPSTDDWPFMYQKDRSLPATYLWGLLVMFVIGVGWVWLLLPSGERSGRGQGQFFWLGVSFLLVEVKGISQLALVWGSTWRVTAIVLGAIMALILAANLLVARREARGTTLPYVLLLASLLGSWLFPLGKVTGGGLWVGQVLPTLVLLLPVFFAAMIFATAFRGAEKAGVALGWNLMGGVAGGFLEYLSVATGFGFLALVAMATYAASWACARGVRSVEQAS